MQSVSTASGPDPAPGPPAKPPRSALTMRDLLGAVVLLVAVVLVFGGLTRGCAFAPTGPTVDPSAGPTVDAPAQLRALAGSAPFPLRVPAVPPGWRANAVGTVRVGAAGHLAVRTGYVLPSGRYLRVVQSDANDAELLASEAKAAGSPAAEQGSAAVAPGPVDVAGTSWVTYTVGLAEPVRLAEVGGVRLLITGSGDDAEFRMLAAATTGGEVLPH
jgi:Protein of unknown function (DUF4245)